MASVGLNTVPAYTHVHVDNVVCTMWRGVLYLVAYPVDTSHILRVLSREVDTRKSPEGMKATLETLWSCPCSVLMHSYVVKSHSRIDISAEQDAGERKEQEGERSHTSS